MQVLVSDASALIDLTRAALLETVFQSRFDLAVPDALYEDELIDFGDRDRAALLRLGLRREPLDEQGLAQALRYHAACSKLTIHDCFALAVAFCHGWPLLTPDPNLTAIAEKDGVEVYDVPWLMERLAEPRVSGREVLPKLRPAVPEVSRASSSARRTRRRVASEPRADTTPDLFSTARYPPRGPRTTNHPFRR